MKNAKKYFSLFIFILISSCDNISSPDELKTEEFEITYEKFGCWINPSELIILRNGIARAKIISPGSSSLDSGETIINTNQKRLLAKYVSVFDRYNSFYASGNYITDQNYNVIIVRRKNTIDTVSVYNLPNANAPETLKAFISELDKIKSGILRNENIINKMSS
jgi:hypothetical protein